MSYRKLYNLLQINGGTFPTGGFSQSWGLETYVSEGTVKDPETFTDFLRTYLTACVGKNEGPVAVGAFEYAKTADWEKVLEIETISNASKVTQESREAGIRMGKAFLRIMEPILDDERLEDFLKAAGTKDISYPVVYGVICGLMDENIEDAVAAYVYSTANTLVQSAVKLVPLGNTDAQRIIFGASEILDETVRLSMETAIDEITNFCPGIDIASIKHETLPVRLYMS